MATKTDLEYCDTCEKKTLHTIEYISFPKKGNGTKDPDYIQSKKCNEHED